MVVASLGSWGDVHARCRGPRHRRPSPLQDSIVRPVVAQRVVVPEPAVDGLTPAVGGLTPEVVGLKVDGLKVDGLVVVGRKVVGRKVDGPGE